MKEAVYPTWRQKEIEKGRRPDWARLKGSGDEGGLSTCAGMGEWVGLRMAEWVCEMLCG